MFTVLFVQSVSYHFVSVAVKQAMLSSRALAMLDRNFISFQVLTGIRIIKYNVWEEHFAQLVAVIRNKELKVHLTIKLLLSTVISLWDMTAAVMSILAIMSYVYLGYQLTAAKVFTVMAVVR